MWNWLGKSKHPLTVSPLCYGKLPIYQDFLSLRGGEASHRFQEWLNCLDRVGQPAVLPQTQRVLFLAASRKHHLVATIWDSSDARGVRKFPFALYLELPPALFPVNSGKILSENLGWWSQLEAAEPALRSVQTADEFYHRLRETRFAPEDVRPAVTENPPASIEKFSSKALARAIFGPQFADGWLRFLWRFHRAARPGSGPGIHNFAVKIPLVGEISSIQQIEAWMKFCRDQSGNKSLLPTVAIWPKEESNPPPASRRSVYLLFREPHDHDVHVLQGQPAAGYFLDLTSRDPEMEVSGYSDFVHATAAWLEKPEADIWNLLPLQK